MNTAPAGADTRSSRESSRAPRRTNHHPCSHYMAAAFAFLFDHRSRLLLLSEQDEGRKYMWDLPGGTLTDYEQPVDGLHREIMEETGLRIELLSPLCWLKLDRHESGHAILVAFYVAETRDSEVSLSEEHQNYRRVSIEQFRQEHLEVSANKEIVEACFEHYLEHKKC
jgi:ADP-ribose pyrophosphatase YjhB (NUDIX family)